MASRTDKVLELIEKLDKNYPVNTKQQKPGSSAKFYAAEGQSRLEEKKNDIKAMHVEIKELTNKIKSLNTLLKKQLKEKEKEIQNLKCENHKLTTELESWQDTRTELNKMMTEKEEATNKLENYIKIEKTRATSVEERLIEMLATITAEKNDPKCTKRKLEEKVKETEQRIKLLQSENYGLQRQIAATEVDQNKKEIETLKHLHENNHSLRKLNEVNLQSKLNYKSTSLSIENRTINYVAPGTFDNLSSLTELLLSNCGLTFLENGVFNNLTNLITLDLHANYLTCLEGNVFEGLKKLKKISLWNNNITKLPPQLFRGLESLQHIYLNYNKISVFDADLLVGLNRLTTFNAHNNSLTSIPEKLFENCVQLESVWLYNNKMVRLKKTIFDSLHNLKKLHLQDNPLNEMDKKALKMLIIDDFKI